MDAFLLLQVCHIVGDNFLDELEVCLLVSIFINKVALKTLVLVRIVHTVDFLTLTATLLNRRIYKFRKSTVKPIVRFLRIFLL